MDAFLTQAFAASLLLGAVTAGLPLLLAGLGEQVSEKAGVLNIGIEGMMLFGAYWGFLAAYSWESAWLGFAAGAAAGAAVAVPMVLLCVVLGLNQIVIGIGLTLAAEGITALLHHVQFSRTYPRLPAIEGLAIPFLSEIPVLGRALSGLHPAACLAVALVAVAAFVYRRTLLGLSLQAAGDKPAALDAAGVGVRGVRAAAVLATGTLAGFGGAYLAVVGAGVFVPFMTNGAGFIAIVLAMLAQGRPVLVLGGALLFGASLSATTALQVAGVGVPTDVVQMLPFAMVMLVLLLFGRRASLPAALGTPYERGAR